MHVIALVAMMVAAAALVTKLMADREQPKLIPVRVKRRPDDAQR
jgi:hypothetical protein